MKNKYKKAIEYFKFATSANNWGHLINIVYNFFS